jgi:Protein of unknown function (DUF3224)
MFTGRHRVGTAAATMLAFALVGGASSAASAHDAHRSARVTFSSAQPGLTAATFAQIFPSDPSRCLLTGAFTPPCTVTTAGAADHDWTFTGTVEGTVKNDTFVAITAVAADVSPSNPDAPFVLMFKVSATVTDCGTGSFIMRIDGNNTTPTRWDWRIVPHSGSDALTTLSGNGTAVSPTFGSWDYSGRVSCRSDDRVVPE